ncbi:uncharacterized protein LOC142624995 [Castanea sativa]|uniref:uncharacterized protein LOC142624995 n=1 Tax=Castanea sativa TaxID=21020 RepID=UPI003F64970B
MAHRHCFEALDRTLRDILCFSSKFDPNKVFGGVTVIVGGDFRQILPVIPKGIREHIVASTINKSAIWNHCEIFMLRENMRLNQNFNNLEDDQSVVDFGNWILRIGNGEFENVDGECWIEIPEDLLIKPTRDPKANIINVTYPDMHDKMKDSQYLQERVILAPTNEIVNEINDQILSLVDEEERVYLSSNTVCKSSNSITDLDTLYPVEFLNSLEFLGIPKHKLKLKVGIPIMLLRNLDQTAGLCNGTRLIVTQLADWVIEAKIITGTNIGSKVFIPRIILFPTESKWPFILKRRQFPISVSFAMTINKSQGQSLNRLFGITMSKGYNFLGQISDAKETWRIRVRICRMWKAVNKRSGNNFISLDMIFIDEKKNLMHAIVRKNVFQKFGAILLERGTFIISNFKVIVTNKDIKLLTSLKDVADDNLIDDVFGNTQLKDLTKQRTSKQTFNNNTGSSQNKKK